MVFTIKKEVISLLSRLEYLKGDGEGTLRLDTDEKQYICRGYGVRLKAPSTKSPLHPLRDGKETGAMESFQWSPFPSYTCYVLTLLLHS